MKEFHDSVVQYFQNNPPRMDAPNPVEERYAGLDPTLIPFYKHCDELDWKAELKRLQQVSELFLSSLTQVPSLTSYKHWLLEKHDSHSRKQAEDISLLLDYIFSRVTDQPGV